MLLRNPAIQIIGNRNERERGTSGTSSGTTTALSPVAAKVPPSLSGNEKPEPHQNPKEEASSRLEALLRCTSQFSVPSQDGDDLNVLQRPPVEVIRFDLSRELFDREEVDTSEEAEEAGTDEDTGEKRYRSSIRILSLIHI